ncbi:MAG: SpoIIE family protein phosphatase, partial [Bacteroidales bacterium]|nr:SpoIIE family protein phosphatase [Bacteroidales bacterium]
IGLSRKKEKSFTNHEINLEKGDSIYIFSDGYIDQFDKNNKEKFKTKRFQELLVRINGMPMNQQKTVLNNIIEKWRGDVEQIDDILVFGVTI